MHIRMIAAPVVYTNNNGGGADELEAPEHAWGSKEFDAGGTVMAAWYCPYDNISDFGAIHSLSVEPDGTRVRLEARGTPGHRDARVRIRIYAQIQ